MASDEEGPDDLVHARYWDDRYGKSDGNDPTHEWFRSYSDLKPFLELHLFEPFKPAQNPKILHLGAGDSTIPKDLLDFGYKDQTCVDFSPVLVKLMTAKNWEGVTWLCEDVRNMPLIESQSIDVAFDKGTMDAMIYGSPWDPPNEVKENTGRYMKEASRVLKDSGVFIYITYRQPHFVKPLLNQDDLWDLKLEVLQGGENSFEYYGFILRKTQSM